MRAGIGERNFQRRADRDADRLAVERVAAGFVEQHGVGAEGGGVAEDRAHIVVVGDADQRQRQSAAGQGGQQLLAAFVLAPPADRQHAAMHRKAGHLVHHGARGDINRHCGWRLGQRRRHSGQPRIEDQRRFGVEARGRKQHVEHDLALGHEPALAADEIALANVAIGGNARIVGIVDRDCGGVAAEIIALAYREIGIGRKQALPDSDTSSREALQFFSKMPSSVCSRRRADSDLQE